MARDIGKSSNIVFHGVEWDCALAGVAFGIVGKSVSWGLDGELLPWARPARG